MKPSSNSPDSIHLLTSSLLYCPLLNAINLACDAHRGQVDKSGDPYLWHVLRVGISLLPDVNAAQVGLLHDVFEDCDPSFRPLVEQLLSSNLAAAVQILTHSGVESYPAYISRVLAAPGAAGDLARNVKRADLLDNLSHSRLDRLHPALRAKLEARYRAALRCLACCK